MTTEKTKKSGGQLIDEAQRASIFKMRPEDVVIIGLDTDHDSTHALYDERAFLPLKEETILSMQALGVLQVAKATVLEIATKTDKTVKRRVVMTDGRRRVLHAREANKRLRKMGEPEISIRIEAESGKRVSDEHLSMSMIAMNELREEDLVLVKAAKAERMIQRGIDRTKVAMAFGVVPQTIDAWLRIRSASAPVRKALGEGLINATTAATLADLPKDEQGPALEAALSEGGGKVTAMAARAVVRASKQKKAGGDGEVRQKPNGRLLTKIVEYAKVNEQTELPEGFLLGLQYAKGTIGPRSVKGLSALLRDLEKPAA